MAQQTDISIKSKTKSKSKSKSAGRKHDHVVNIENNSITSQMPINKTIVDIELDKWPYCIVWTPLPIVTWFIPIIGHTGIANSKGIIYDFSDDYNVSIDNFSFGTPTKYFQFDFKKINGGPKVWDKAIQETSDYYSKTRHSLCFNNCHQYIAGVLNKINYEGRNNWNQYEVWRKITFNSYYTGFLGFLRQWWPFTIIILIAILLLVLIL